jgi:hypothetical protein
MRYNLYQSKATVSSVNTGAKSNARNGWEVEPQEYYTLSRLPKIRLVGIELNPGPRRGGRQFARSGSNSNRPPQMSANLRLRHKYRFTASSAINGGIFSDGILLAAGTMATTIALVNSFIGSFRIRSVEVWSPPAAQGAFATCSLDWQGGPNSPNVEVSDTTVSVTSPAHFRTAPPARSLAGFWQTHVNNNQMFTLVLPVGSIVDLDLDLVMYDEDSTETQATRIVAAATIGTVYYLALDNPGGAHNLVPVSLTTTF